jgi:hypothetical protein
MRFFKFVEEVFETIVGFLAVLAMGGCFVFGLVLVGAGFRELIFGSDHSSKALIDAVLRGLEMFFLAPLPFLAFRSITRLIRAWINCDANEIQTVRNLEVAQEDVGWVKRFITGLMIAVVSTDLIHRIIAGGSLEVITTGTILGLIAALSFYYWASRK